MAANLGLRQLGVLKEAERLQGGLLPMAVGQWGWGRRVGGGGWVERGFCEQKLFIEAKQGNVIVQRKCEGENSSTICVQPFLTASNFFTSLLPVSSYAYPIF
jgi:hypothetical protein